MVPFLGPRIVETEDRQFRASAVRIVVRYRLVRLFRPPLEQRFEDRHDRREGKDLDVLEVAADAVEHPHGVGLTEGAQRPLPTDAPGGPQ